MNGKREKQAQRGFTLIEIMIALLIVGILATFATTSYSDYTRRANRAEARAVMLEGAQFMQRFHSVNNAYNRDRAGNAVVLPASLSQSPRSGSARYRIRLRDNMLTPFGWVLDAVPVNEDACGTLSLDNLGRWWVPNVDSATEAACLR